MGPPTDRSWGERNGADVGDWNGSTSPRKEFGGGGRGFMNDNWRRHRGGGEDEDGWRTSSRSDKWGRSSSWREVEKDGTEVERGGGSGRGQSWERGRSWDDVNSAPSHHPHRRPWEEDNLPEWANENPSESGGSFDASGAFHRGAGYSDDEEDGGNGNRNNNHVRDGPPKHDNTGVKHGNAMSIPNRRSAGNDTDVHERENRVNSETNRTDMSDRSPDMPHSSNKSKVPAKSSPPVLNHKTPPPPTLHSSVKKSSVSDTSSKSHHQSSSGQTDSARNSVFPDNSTEQIGNHNKVGSSVKSDHLNGCVRESVSRNVTKMEGPSHNRQQSFVMGRQKSEDDMEHMQEVADNLVAKLMDDEESQEKSSASAAEKLFYRDPQGEVQGPFLSSEMDEWFNCGYFTLNLLVKRSCDSCYSQLDDLMKLWGRNPFQPGPIFPPLKTGEAAPTPTSTTAQPGLTPPVSAHSGIDQELFMQQYQYQLLQRQFLIRHQAVAGKLSQNEHWNALTPMEQQQLIMQQLLTQPITPQQPIDAGLTPFMQQMAATHPHKNSVFHFLSQLQQPKVPTTSVPESQHSSTPSQTPVLDPLQQLIQQMGALQQPTSGHQNILHSHPTADSTNKAESESNQFQLLLRQLTKQHQLDSVWGSNVAPPGSIAAPSWVNHMPAAPPGQLPLSSLWDLHGKDIKTEQQILEEQIRAEEERRREEMRKQEEIKRRTEQEEEKRKQLEEELRIKEAEKQRLEEKMQKLEEEKKRELLRQKQKLAEEAAERKRQQEEAKRLEEEALARKREETAKKKEEEKRRREEEKGRKRKLEEERKREEEERKRLEEELTKKKQQQEEEERRLEQQRRQTEALRRLQEQQQCSKAAPWSQQTPGAGSSLADIQRQEKEKKERELREQQHLLQLQQQQQQQQQQQMQLQAQAEAANNPLQLKWAERKPMPANSVKSLAEIQAEEAEHMAKEKERAERAQQQNEKVLPISAGIWGTASQSLNWTSVTGNSTSVWGSAGGDSSTSLSGTFNYFNNEPSE